MNYRHIYHAGNFADVAKHLFLIALLNHFKQKDTPFCYLDTHAGIGLYDLTSEQALKKQEYDTGVLKIVDAQDKVSSEILQYINIIQAINKDNQLQFYPGSPWIAKSLLRENDQLILCELHSDDYQTLKNNFKAQKNCAIHCQDAYLGMKAFLPPKEKRGLVLIDPPFEVTDEFDRIVNALHIAIKHFQSGCYMVWYPIKDKKQVKHFIQNVSKLEKPYLNYEFNISESVAKTALQACGILIINPPWKLEDNISQNIMPYLHEIGITTALNGSI